MAHQLHRSPFFRRLSPSNDTGAGPVCVSRGGAGAGGAGGGGGGGEGNGVHTPPVSLSASDRFQPSWMEGRGAEGRGRGGGRGGGGGGGIYLPLGGVRVLLVLLLLAGVWKAAVRGILVCAAAQLSSAQLSSDRPTADRESHPCSETSTAGPLDNTTTASSSRAPEQQQQRQQQQQH